MKERGTTVPQPDRVQAAIDRYMPDQHVMIDARDWPDTWKETILALKGVPLVLWDELLKNETWWNRYGNQPGGVNPDGTPIIKDQL